MSEIVENNRNGWRSEIPRTVMLLYYKSTETPFTPKYNMSTSRQSRKRSSLIQVDRVYQENQDRSTNNC